MRRETSTVERIPYAAHVSPQLVKTVFGDYVQVIRLAAASFECADDETLNTWHERLNVLWRNIASPQVALWAHVIRRRERTVARGRGPKGFAGALEHKYRSKLSHQKLMVNELYLSTVYRPTAGVATGLAARLLKRARAERIRARARRCARCVRETSRDRSGLARPLRAGGPGCLSSGRAGVFGAA